MGVRTDVYTGAHGDVGGPEVVEEDERADVAPGPRGDDAPDSERVGAALGRLGQDDE